MIQIKQFKYTIIPVMLFGVFAVPHFASADFTDTINFEIKGEDHIKIALNDNKSEIQKPKIEISDNDHDSYEKASRLFKEGKDEDAKKVIKDKKVNNIEKPQNLRKPEIKQAIEKAKEYEMQGKPTDAKKVLKDIGITDKSKQKIESEFSSEGSNKDMKPKKLINILKDFFGLEKPE